MSRPAELASLEGRLANCYCCKRVEPSNPEGQFAFEYRGADSREAKEICGNCGYHFVTHSHDARARNPSLDCFNFVPRGPQDTDLFYCGCRGYE